MLQYGLKNIIQNALKNKKYTLYNSTINIQVTKNEYSTERR